MADIEGQTEQQLASRTVNALIILRAIAPSLTWLLAAPRLRLRDDWTTHHDADIYGALRERLEKGASAASSSSGGTSSNGCITPPTTG